MYETMVAYYHSQARHALRMAGAHRGNARMRLLWLERAADYRECIVDRLRARSGWTLAERVAGSQHFAPGLTFSLRQRGGQRWENSRHSLKWR